MSANLYIKRLKNIREKNKVWFEDQVLLYSFVGKMVKNGDRLFALKIMSNVFLKLKKQKIKELPLNFLISMLQRIKPLVNLRVKKVAGISYQLPSPITNERACKLAVMWFFLSVSNRGEKRLEDRIYGELLDISNNKGMTKQKKNAFEKIAVSNRPFIHFLKR